MRRLLLTLFTLTLIAGPVWSQEWKRCDDEPTQHGCAVPCTHGFGGLYWYVVGLDVTYVTEEGCVPTDEESYCVIHNVVCGAHYNCWSSTTCPGPCFRYRDETAPSCVGTIIPPTNSGDSPIASPPPSVG